MKGTVKNIKDRGFGFILGEDGKEYFMHRQDYIDDWDELKAAVESGYNIQVRFTDGKGPKGLRASKVERW